MPVSLFRVFPSLFETDESRRCTDIGVGRSVKQSLVAAVARADYRARSVPCRVIGSAEVSSRSPRGPEPSRNYSVRIVGIGLRSVIDPTKQLLSQ